MPEYTYPLNLIEGRPYIRIGKIHAAIYWGAIQSFGKEKKLRIAGERVELQEPVVNGLDAHYNPDYFTAHYKTPTQAVLGFLPFVAKSFTFDLAKHTLTFHDQWLVDNEWSVTKRVAYTHEGLSEVPFVTGKIDGVDHVLQTDVGDPYSILPDETLAKFPVVEVVDMYLSERDTHISRVPLYEVPIRLSHNVTLRAKARALTEHEKSVFSIVGTNGCLGVDLIKNDRVTLVEEYDPRIQKYREIMRFEAFKTTS